MRFSSPFHRRALSLIGLTVALLLMPVMALASEENVVLKFGQSDFVYLGISAAIGLLAIVVAFALRSKILSLSPGDEKMQEVGKAIMDGANAYLAKQGRSIAVAVIVLGIALGALYTSKYDMMTGVLIAVAFVLGVAASYFAGFTGMRMAVQANMRSAHAALGKFSQALEIAFRSGAVAGLMTVGMGLVGATLIFWFGGPNSMKLLIGFGFGGSLAALFMRVGGGIYTKAADVGADLVGKVEAGIPEDDPRNPAVIADNVGDNVGDCAGMAADVFESYEVTLVAAIVLGAATATMFDQATWMRLVLFALMARGVGIIASIAGIFMVKGSDNVDDSALKPISKGFKASAAIAAVLTIGLAWFMMGGMSEQSKIYSHEFVSREEAEFQQRKAILDVRDRLAKTKKVEKDQVTSDDVAKDPEITKLIADEQERTGAVSSALTMPESMVKKPEPMHGYVPFDAKDKNSKVGQYATQFVPMDKAVNADPSKAPEPIVDTIANRIASGGDLRVFTVNVTMTPTAQPGQPKPEERTNKVYIGPVSRTDLDAVIKNATKNPGSPKIQVEGEGRKVEFFTNDEGKLIAAVDDPKNEVKIERVQPIQPLTFFKADVKRVNEALAKQKANPNQMAAMPASDSVTTVRLVKKLVPWWTFVACILFGIAMAYLFERLTDYYVSLDRKPVKEVAQVATAGPAPMIIQGFALASESSFFNAIAIVLCLMAPMMIFPVALYGNFILSFYGIALVGLGLLTTTGYILAMDTFGPISDNAQGVFEMSGAGHDNPVASKGIQRLDAAGNTTKALTKGFAIATAVVAATALFHSFVEAAKLESVGMRIDVPQIFLGFIVGGAAPYLFSAFSINAVGRAAFQLINEVRSQFRNDPGIMAGTSKPNYGKCVEIVTTAAQRELAGPGILAIALPIAVAYGFSIGNTPVEINGVAYNLTGAQALGGFLAGCILSGQLLAVLLANSGGIWDNAKKLIEDGLHGGKGTEAHKAGVVCDTVGDPFKDTAGPALNPLIKVMNLIALLLAPVIIMPVPVAVSAGVTAVAVIALGYAVWYSKRGSFGSEMAAASGPDAIPEQSSAAPKPVQKPASDETKSE